MVRAFWNHETDVSPAGLARPTAVTLAVDIEYEEVITSLGRGSHIEGNLVVASEVIVETHVGMAAVPHRSGMSAVKAFVWAMANDLPSALAFKLPVIFAKVARLKVFHLAVHVEVIGIHDDIMP